MTASPSHPPCVLFVDDDRSFLEVLQEAFGTFSKGGWRILTASDAGATSRLLKQQAVDLIVLDVDMPEISGLQLLAILNKEYPDTPKAMLTSIADESTRVTGLEGGADLYLEKPTDLEGMRSVYASLNELLKWKRRQSTPSKARLLDIVKLECASGNSRVLDVFFGDVRGQIFIREGTIIHAEAPGRRGQSAFTFLTSQPQSEYNLRQFFAPPERSVDRQWEFLYLEASQLLEQLIQAAAEAKAREAAPPRPDPAAAVSAPPDTAPAVAAPITVAPAPAAVPAPVSPVPPPPPPPPTPTPIEPEATPPARIDPALAAAPPASAPAPQETLAPSLRMAHPVSPESEMVLEPPPIAEPAPVPEPRPSPRVAPPNPIPSRDRLPGKVQIEEMLVVTLPTEVLYEWQCSRTELRLQLIDGLHDESQRLAQHLPLGECDRLEGQSTDERMVVYFHDESAVLFRSNGGAPLAPGDSGVFHQSMGGWLARHSKIRGLLGCGILRPSQSPLSQPSPQGFAPQTLGVAWRCVHSVFERLDLQAFPAWQIRWLYDQAQLYAVRRADGKALCMFLSRDPEALDVAATERVFTEFKTLDAV